MHLINWDSIAQPIIEGGLGLKPTHLANTCLLGKLVWSLINDKDKLWVAILSHKYLGDQSILEASCPTACSAIWRAIFKTAYILKDGFRVQLGDGSFSFWFDPWTHEGPLCNMVDFIHISDSQLMVKDCWEEGSWMLDNIWTRPTL